MNFFRILGCAGILVLEGCASSASSSRSAVDPATMAALHPAQEKLCIVIANHDDKSDDITSEIASLKEAISKGIQKENIFAAVGDDNANVTLTVTITHLKKVDGFTRVMMAIMYGPARISVDYTLTDTASRTIYRSGHINAQSDNLGGLSGYQGVTTQAFAVLAQKLALELKAS